MIRAVFAHDFSGFSLSGHAGYADAGEDIVCAAVSAMANLAVNGAEAFGAVTVDYSKDYMMFRLTDTTRRIDDFINLMRDYTILEICRTGSVSLEKGSTTIRQIINL